MRTEQQPMADACALAEDIVFGRTSASAELSQTLARIEAINPDVRAVASVNGELGMARAEAMDRDLARLDRAARIALLARQPFYGVPLLLKDLSTAAQGLPSTMGSRLYGQVEWPQDANLVQRYRAAGLVPFGRTTSSELGLSPTTESPCYGPPTRNPWQREHSAGGSSGGAAAAIASGMVRIAHATDGGGSIRIPASCCGLLGLKPSRGLVPLGPDKGEGWGGLAVEHVLSVSVRDCAAALDVSAGMDAGAPYAAPALSGSARAKVAEVMAAPERLERQRIGVLPTQTTDWQLDEDVAAVLSQAVRFLGSLGHGVEPIDEPVSARETLQHMLALIACNASAAIQRREAQLGRAHRQDELQATTRGMLRYAEGIRGTEYAAHVAAGHAATRRLSRLLAAHPPAAAGQFDLLLSPVLAGPPARLGRYAMDWEDYLDYRLGPEGLIRYSPFTPLANLAGCPSIAIPFGTSRQGLPIGIQLSAALGQDHLLLRLAAQVQALRPWPGVAPGFSAR